MLDRPERVAALTSPLAWRIMQELAKAPDYPNALAERLKVHEQKVYYHVRRLEAAGLLKVLREEAKRGASARILAPTAEAFAIVLKGRGNPVASPRLPPARVIVVLSGLHAVGTMAAILGLTHFAEEVLDGYAPGEDFYRVVAGQDRDGDGRLDAVSILE